MVIVLHGDDIQSSYLRLSSYLNNYSTYTKIGLTTSADFDRLWEEVLAVDIFLTPRLVVVDNYLSSRKFDFKLISNIPRETVVIFWEQKAISQTTAKKLPAGVIIEYFKSKSFIFNFLDSIAPNAANMIKALFFLHEDNILWQITNRFMLLLLVKLGYSRQRIESITLRKIADWQWDRLRAQSSLFESSTLSFIFSGLVKIDYLIKSGSTSLSDKDLINILLLKYIKS